MNILFNIIDRYTQCHFIIFHYLIILSFLKILILIRTSKFALLSPNNLKKATLTLRPRVNHDPAK